MRPFSSTRSSRPRWCPHPVRMMGWPYPPLKVSYEGIPAPSTNTHPARPLRHRGLLTYLASFSPLFSYEYSRPAFTASRSTWSGCPLSIKSLKDAAEAHCRPGSPRRGEARLRLSHIVGRDTDGAGRVRVLRATVETVAENTSDGSWPRSLFRRRRPSAHARL